MASAAAENAVRGRIMLLRQMQDELRTQPITGKWRRIKRLVFDAVRTAFGRQFGINKAMLDLVETLHREISRQGSQLAAHSATTSLAPSTDSTPAIRESPTYGQPTPEPRLSGLNNVCLSTTDDGMAERIALYSLIFGMQPRRCLQVGSAVTELTGVICAALDDLGLGQITGVVSTSEVNPQLWQRISSRCRVIEGQFPTALQSLPKHNAPFDLAICDGAMLGRGVDETVTAVSPLLADRAYLLLSSVSFLRRWHCERAIQRQPRTHRLRLDMRATCSLGGKFRIPGMGRF